MGSTLIPAAEVSPTLCWILGIAPALWWLWLLVRKDNHEPEPRRFLLGTFALGALAASAAMSVRVRIEVAFDLSNQLWLDVFVVTALGEELWKVAAFVPAYLHRENDEPLDAVIYAVAAALGFSAFENVMFMQQSDSLTLGLQRAFTATLAHVAFTGSFGYWLGRARFGARSRRARRIMLGAVIAVVTHGIYDLLLNHGGAPAMLALLVVLPLLLFVFAQQLRSARARSSVFHPRA